MKQYLKKVIVIYSLVFGLLEAPAPIVAPFLAAFVSGSIFADEEAITEAPAAVTQDVGSLLTYYRTLAQSSNPRNIIDGQGKQILEDTQSLLIDDTNQADFETDEGKELLAYHNKFLNYFETKAKLDKCMEETRHAWGDEKVARFGRDLDQRTLNGLLAADVSSFDCHGAITNKTSLDQLYEETMVATEGVKLSALEETIYKNSFKKVAKAWLKTKYNYDKEFAPGNNLTSDEKSAMEEALCAGGNCSSTQQAVIDETIPSFMQELSASNTTRYSSEEASADVSSKIDELNELTSSDALRMDSRGSWLKLGFLGNGSTLDRDGDGTLAAIATYQQKYLELSATGAGSLMWTNAVQDASGAMKDVKNWDWTSDDEIRITPHTGVTKEVMDQAITEVLGHVSEQAKTINDHDRRRREDIADTQKTRRPMASRVFKNRRQSTIDEYVKMSPAIVGESLAQHPENVEAICTAIYNSIRDNRNEVWWDNATMAVTVAAGVVVVAGGAILSLTGVGTPAGIAMASLGAGLAIGALDSAYTYHRMGEERDQHNALLNTYFGGAGDEYTLIEAKEALDNYEAAVTNFNYALGFTALDVATLGLSKFGRHINPMRIQRVADFYRAAADTGFGRKLASLMNGFSAAKKAAYRLIIDKIALSNTSGNMLELLNRMSFGNLEFLLDKFYGLKSLCTGATCAALDEGIEALAARNTDTLTRSQIDELTSPLFAKHTNNNPALGDGITTGPSMGAFDGPTTNGALDLIGDAPPAGALIPPADTPLLPVAPRGFDAPVVRGADDAADRANALRVIQERDAARVAEELAEARRLAEAVEAEKVAVGITESERFARAARSAEANAAFAERARLAKAAELARANEMAAEAATETERFSRAARVASLNEEARAAARLAEEAAKVAEEARAAATLTETERFSRMGRIQDENIRIINQARIAREADAARVAAELAETRRLAALTRSADVADDLSGPYRAAARDRAAREASQDVADDLAAPYRAAAEEKAREAARIADELAETRRLAAAIEAEKVAAGITESERFSRATRVAEANAAFAERARLAKAAELARANEIAAEAATETERFSRAARVASINEEARAAARLAEDAARVAEEARTAAALTETERFSRMGRIQDENIRIINQARAAREADAARVAAELAEARRLAAVTRSADVADDLSAPYRARVNESYIETIPRDRSVVVARNTLPEAVDSAAARERATRNAIAEREIRGLPSDRAPVVRGETSPVVRGAVDDSRDLTRGLDGEILGPEIATRRPVAGAIEADPIELTARDVTPVATARAIDGPTTAPRLEAAAPAPAVRAPGTALALRTAEAIPTAARSVGRKIADFFRNTVARLSPSAGRAITHETAPAGESSVVVAPEELDLDNSDPEPTSGVEPETETTETVVDETTGEVSCDEEGFELVDVEGEDRQVCERVTCDEGFEVNDEKDGCNIICEEGLVPNADQTACGTEGLFPQGINMIRRGIRTLGGLW